MKVNPDPRVLTWGGFDLLGLRLNVAVSGEIVKLTLGQG